MPKRTTPATFWARADKTGSCWIWTGYLTAEGYGRVRVDGCRRVLAHRLAYEFEVGPIPDGLTIDHLCRNRACVNPDHLEPVTNRENILRGISPIAVNAAKMVCIHGHEFTATRENGGRRCRVCANLANRRYRARLAGC